MLDEKYRIWSLKIDSKCKHFVNVKINYMIFPNENEKNVLLLTLQYLDLTKKIKINFKNLSLNSISFTKLKITHKHKKYLFTSHFF